MFFIARAVFFIHRPPVFSILGARGVPHQWMLIDSYWYGESRFSGTYLWEDGAWLGTPGTNATAWPARFNPGAAPLKRLAEYTKLRGFGAHVSDSPCTRNGRREGGQSLVVGGSSLVRLEGKACDPLQSLSLHRCTGP